MEPDDTTLILGCRHGDQAAWDLLVSRYERLVYSIARRSGLPPEQAADVYQHVFTTLIERLADIQQPAAIAGWLSKTAQHEAWRVRRREYADSLRFTSTEQALTVADTAPLPSDQLLLLEEQQRVRNGVAALGARCRRLLTLLFYEHEPPSYTEIAALLGMSEGSIGPTRARCLEKLRQLLGEANE